MADYSDPKRGVAYRFTISLFDRSTGQIKTTPTLAAGDVKVSKDNGATANITTLPSEAPASSGIVQVDLSGTEMTADIVTIIFRDASGAEWNDVSICLTTAARQMADLAYPATSGRSMVVDANGLVDANTVKVGPTGSGTAQTAGDIIGDTNDIQTRLPAALVSGRIDASVGAMAANVLTATAINDDAITAAKVASDVGTEIGTAVWATAARTLTANTNLNDLNAAGIRAAVGMASANLDTQIGTLATTSALATVAGYIDTEVAAIKAKTDNLPTDPADQSLIIAATDALATLIGDVPTNAELATALATADDAVLAQIALVKAQTDGLTFTVPGQVDVNIQYVNDVEVNGNGQPGTEWGP